MKYKETHVDIKSIIFKPVSHIMESIYNYIPENVLKWSTDSDTNLTVVCRHRWSRLQLMKTAVRAESF